MRFGRHVFTSASGSDPGLLSGQLRSGVWLVQAGCEPPASHRPASLLAGAISKPGLESGLALTLTSACALQRNLGMALIGRVAEEGCVVTPLAALALHEMVLNAVIHGNLAVGSGPAREWHDLAVRERQIAEALRDATRAARLVTVAAGWNAGCLVTAIADQGSGYRPKAWTRQAGEQGPRAGAGRGLMIARAACRVDVLRAGRCTRLTFPCLPAPDAKQPAQASAVAEP